MQLGMTPAHEPGALRHIRPLRFPEFVVLSSHGQLWLQLTTFVASSELRSLMMFLTLATVSSSPSDTASLDSMKVASVSRRTSTITVSCRDAMAASRDRTWLLTMSASRLVSYRDQVWRFVSAHIASNLPSRSWFRRRLSYDDEMVASR